MRVIQFILINKKTRFAVVIIFLLLVTQAFCDLNLPKITSKIVDVGITQGGIEDAVPEFISKDSLDNLTLFMSDADAKTVSAAFAEDKDAKAEDMLKLKSSYEKDEEARTELADIFKGPMLMNYVLDGGAASGAQAAGAAGEKLEEEKDKSAATNLFAGADLPEKMPTLDELKQGVAAGMIPKEQLTDMVKEAEKAAGKMGETTVNTVAIQYISGEYESHKIDTEAIQFSYMVKTGLHMLAFTLISVCASILVTLLASITGSTVARILRERSFNRVLDYSNAEMDKFSASSLITRATNDITQIQMGSMMFLRMVIYAPILAIGGIIMVLSTDTGLTWIIAVAVVVLLAVVSILMSVTMPKFKKMQTLIDNVNLVAREMLTGLPVIRAFCRDRYEEERFDKKSKILMGTQLFTSRSMAMMMPIIMLIMNVISISIVWFGAKGIDAGDMQVGGMLAFISYAMQIVMSFMMLSMVAIMLPRANVAAERVHEVIITESSIHDKPENEQIDKPNFKGLINFNDVCFRFPDADADVLSNISFSAHPGETTAIIGSTGSGKSTLINLIPRLFDVTSGSITIDGIDIRDMSQHRLRSLLGVVPQKGILFSGDIRSNLTFGTSSGKPDSELLEVARIAQAEEFIEEKEGGLDAAISQGGTNVSGGQKQRLSIARAITKDPTIFIFDDSFSALDYKTDSRLRSALAKNLGYTTVIIVAQRISTILRADKIIVLDEGKIVGIGTHKELLKTCEIYNEIACSQLSEEELSA
ncbi:MAG: ABC transporter ATP-binding protein/permease [Clostridiales Family XIII bacterium]|nr:ABC transporter ATP-binding protein/permease [Clostridiales Family XIII bacterium]